ncbi:MAG: NAD(P)/FAD-dependent oxidoreductase [Oscillospiraceae bacterium]|jgi:glycerol-3-phosphate dehydrogenase|nr:NAD(P)/FAD-dependent oxidoreductase [Oscillospiraceae bacterium]
MIDVAVIGCGIVGAAAAYELSRYELSVAVLERENDVSMGATKANSAIIHAGYDPEPGTLMARLNIEGAGLAKELCEKLDVPHKQCGALVVAFSGEEIAGLERLLRNGVQNGVPGIRILPKDQALAMEPGLSGEVAAALYAPTAMIVSPWEYALALAETAVRNGADLRLECAVTGIDKIAGGYGLRTVRGPVEARTVINAAGLYADTIHDMAAEPAFTVLPSRGEYCLLDKSEGTRVSHVIFQCPAETGKGVLVAPTVHGNLIAGPSSESLRDRADLSVTAEKLEFVMRTAKKAVPGIDFRANIRNFAGNRAKSGHGDFIIAEAKGAPGFIDLAGIASPGLSAAPAIARMAVGLLGESGLALREKRDFYGTRGRVRFRELTSGEKAALVRRDPAYGRVICRCETVTEGEIRDALLTPVPPRSVDGVKRRCGAGMGRCQGGFCGPRVLEILAGHYHCKPSEIVQDGAGTWILASETKGGAGPAI